MYEELICDLEQLLEDSLKFNVKFNEDLTDPKALISEVVEYLGLVLHHGTKQVRVVDKVIDKLKRSWLHEGNWTVGQFRSHASILFYTSYATGQKMGRWEPALQLWARISGMLARHEIPETFKMSKLDISEDDRKSVDEWTLHAIANDWIDVDPLDQQADFIAVTDASAEFWSGMLISGKSGHYTVVTGKWPEHLTEQTKSSATAEPLALLGLIRHLFPQAVRRVTIDHITDNQGLKGTLNKGYSTEPGYLVNYALGVGWPGIKVRSYCPGERIPVDDTSRGATAFEEEKLRAFLTDFIKITPTGYKVQEPELGVSASSGPTSTVQN